MGPLFRDLIEVHPNDDELGAAVRELGKVFAEANSPHPFTRLANNFPNDRELGNLIRTSFKSRKK